jgi:hypothetical protein
MLPPQQRLDARHLACGQHALGLIVEQQLAPLDGPRQLPQEVEPRPRVRVALGGVEGHPVALVLGLVHGDVGAPQERLPVVGMLGEERHADARLDVNGHSLHLERGRERGPCPFARGARLGGVRCRHDHGELVAAQPRQGALVVERAPVAVPDEGATAGA